MLPSCGIGEVRKLPDQHRPLPSLLTFVLLSLLVLIAACAETPVRPFDIARIGVVAPLTGEFAFQGRDVVEATRLAVEEWNETGGVRGLHLELIPVDEAVSPRRLLIDQRVLAVTGYPSPDAAKQARVTYGDAANPVAVNLARGGSDTPPDGVVELAPVIDQVQEVAAAAVAFNFGPSSVTIVSSGTAEDIAAAQRFAAVAKERGLDIRGTITLAAIETNYAQAAMIVRSTAAQLVYITGHGFDAGALWAELRPRDSRIRLVVGPGAFDEGFRRTAGGFFEGVSAIDLMLRPADAPEAADFIRAYTARFGRAPTVLAARAYDGARLTLQAVADAAQEGRPNRAAVRSALSSITEFEGVLRTYPLANGVPSAWKLAIYRLDREGDPTLIGEPEIRE
jgi:branched-chain amino acid transport system substrate-binding protein